MNLHGKIPNQERLARLRADLRIGLPVACEIGAFAALEFLPRARFEALAAKASACKLILSPRRALDLGLSRDPSRPSVLHLPRNFSFEMARALADPALDLDYPGKGPLAPASLADPWPLRILDFCKYTRALPAALLVESDDIGGDAIDEEIWALIKTPPNELELVAKARLPLRFGGAGQIQLFRSRFDDSEHQALIFGEPGPEPLTRLHSACFTGDCLGSLKCDCGEQLHMAMEMMREEGGVLIYLSQEGRGIGLANKLRAYALQDQGYDTFEANQRLGFADDERDFAVGVEILRKLKIDRVRLLTNNPRKLSQLAALGVEIAKRVPLRPKPNEENHNYIALKQSKSGHLP